MEFNRRTETSRLTTELELSHITTIRNFYSSVCWWYCNVQWPIKWLAHLSPCSNQHRNPSSGFVCHIFCRNRAIDSATRWTETHAPLAICTVMREQCAFRLRGSLSELDKNRKRKSQGIWKHHNPVLRLHFSGFMYSLLRLNAFCVSWKFQFSHFCNWLL